MRNSLFTDFVREKTETLENIVDGAAIEKARRLVYIDDSIKTSEVFEKHILADKKAIKIIENCAKSFALGLFVVICVLEPAHITLGGNVAYHNPRLVAAIKDSLLTGLVHKDPDHILERLTVSTIGAGLLSVNHDI
ncbi:ROK family protein [Fundicoccus sp. Sow4_D5]|uniref:ROK family protein n=1 Tax=Fundicoccus sp. Sow4_D5 TaxID=3438782 RepID=UPI003F9101E5